MRVGARAEPAASLGRGTSGPAAPLKVAWGPIEAGAVEPGPPPIVTGAGAEAAATPRAHAFGPAREARVPTEAVLRRQVLRTTSPARPASVKAGAAVKPAPLGAPAIVAPELVAEVLAIESPLSPVIAPFVAPALASASAAPELATLISATIPVGEAPLDEGPHARVLHQFPQLTQLVAQLAVAAELGATATRATVATFRPVIAGPTFGGSTLAPAGSPAATAFHPLISVVTIRPRAGTHAAAPAARATRFAATAAAARSEVGAAEAGPRGRGRRPIVALVAAGAGPALAASGALALSAIGRGAGRRPRGAAAGLGQIGRRQHGRQAGDQGNRPPVQVGHSTNS